MTAERGEKGQRRGKGRKPRKKTTPMKNKRQPAPPARGRGRPRPNQLGAGAYKSPGKRTKNGPPPQAGWPAEDTSRVPTCLLRTPPLREGGVRSPEGGEAVGDRTREWGSQFNWPWLPSLTPEATPEDPHPNATPPRNGFAVPSPLPGTPGVACPLILRVAWHGPRGGSPGHIRRRGPVPQKLDLFLY